MTFPAQTAYNVFACNGVQTVFAYTFEIPEQPDALTTPAVTVNLIVPGTPTVITPLVLNTDYTLSNVGGQAGGNLTMQGAHSPPSNGVILIAQRGLHLAQETTFPNQGFLPSDIEAALDQSMQTMQQLGIVPDLSKVTTVAGLPAASTVPFTRRFVTDATAAIFGAAPTGGGGLTLSVFSDGVIWRMA